jgi:hypothetical protein
VIGFARSFVMVITVVAMLLGHLLPVGEHSLLLQNLRNGLHAPVFLLFSVITWRVLVGSTRGNTQAKATLVTVAFAVAVATGGEMLQHLQGQPFSLRDLTFDLIGCGTAMLYLNGRAVLRRSGINRAARIVTLSSYVLLSMLLLPPGRSALTLIARADAMPQLVSPDSSLLRENLEGRSARISPVAQAHGWPVDSEPVLRIETSAGKYAGVAVLDPHPDWRNYTNLSFLAASGDGRERRLTLRIHDEEHNQSYEDRFNRSWHLGRPVIDGRKEGIDQPRRFCVPLSDIEQAPMSRTLDLSGIAGMAFFVTDARAGDVFLLSDVRLERLSGKPCGLLSYP